MDNSELKIYQLQNHSILTNQQLANCIASVIQQRSMGYGRTIILQSILGDELATLIDGNTKQIQELTEFFLHTPFVVVDKEH